MITSARLEKPAGSKYAPNARLTAPLGSKSESIGMSTPSSSRKRRSDHDWSQETP